MPDLITEADHHRFLSRLAESLGQTVSDHHGGLLVHVASAAGGLDVGMLPLDGEPPADALLGAEAPEHWTAVGVATCGRAFPLGGRPDRDAPADVNVVVLVPRHGEIVGRVEHAGRVITEPPAYGATLDCLQRALGLPTAPPPVPATHLLAITWLERVIDAGRRGSPTWREIRALHPANGTLAVEGGDGLPRLGPDLEAMFEWGRLRQLVIDGRWEEPGLAPEHAAWFDDGSFSRWLLSLRPSVPMLLAELRSVIGRPHARQCATALRRAGVDLAA